MSIVGWSLGGIFARRLALRAPRDVRQVITLGSPFASTGRDPDDAGHRAYRRLAAVHADRRIHPSAGRAQRPLPVPSTAVFSRRDGVVDWRACIQEPGPRSENVEVRASHLGLGHHPAVLWLIADRLAQPRGEWRPFEPPAHLGLRGLFPGEGPAPEVSPQRPR